MFWGSGSAIGVLSVIGYLPFVYGAALLWARREDVPVWMHDEVGAVRNKIVRHAALCESPGLREESRFKMLPARFLRQLGRIPRRKINRGAILLFVGPLLLLLDRFI
jgi:hypothetical protein